MGTTIEAVAVTSGGWRRRHSARRLADAAAEACLAAARVPAGAVDLLVNTGVYRDHNLGEPALAALIQEDIGANPGDPPIGGHGTFSFDVANGTCGPLTALQLVDGLLATGTAGRALVVASDANPGDGMAPGFPFGPTGGAVLCGSNDSTEGFVDFRWANFPEFTDMFDAQVRFERKSNVLRVREAPEFAARAAAAAADVGGKLLADHGLAGTDVDAIVAAPLTTAYLDGLADGLDVRRERIVTPSTPGTHTAALVFALESLRRDARYSDARTVLFIVAGAGITVGSALYRS